MSLFYCAQCIAVGRRLTVLQWKHNAAWTTWCSAADTDTIDGFLLVKELNASEPPSLVTIIESTEPGNEWILCCGIKHHFELISADGTTRALHTEATIKPQLVAALDLREDEEPELLLCYNSEFDSTRFVIFSKIISSFFCLYNRLFADTCHFQKISEENATSTEFDFNWNSVPLAVGELLLLMCF